MDTYNCIKKTSQVKTYLSKDVKHRDIAKILDAAHYAPSSGNIQNWRFIVIRNQETKEKIARVCLDQLWMQEAPAVIVVCSDSSNIKSLYQKKWKKYSKENCAAAAQNLTLQATELGLSSCWIRTFNELRLKNVLKIPDEISVEAVITIGYSNEKPKEQRHKLEELTFFESYGSRKRDTSMFPLAKHLAKFRK
ncbi:nitroreductase family protein [Candidatus Woesearchaeota archaeon]|nr:nitroreductase family protein [Candidatus Woesearchaeota archaeon]